MKTLWLSPLEDECQACGGHFHGVMYDARLPGIGWGNYCNLCFIMAGGKLGTGFGQRYELQPHGEHKAWVKVAG